jgi:predicted RNA binding protein YcfA (HicA-like mRNA interferase family)
MAKLPRLNAAQAGGALTSAGFALVRTKGSHRIFMLGNIRVIVPFHANRTLHPKVVKQVLAAIEMAKGRAE